jgi:hypothetical protein
MLYTHYIPPVDTFKQTKSSVGLKNTGRKQSESRIDLTSIRRLITDQQRRVETFLAEILSDRARAIPNLFHYLFERWNQGTLSRWGSRFFLQEKATGRHDLTGYKVVNLQKGALLCIKEDHDCSVIRCVSGTLWITQAGDLNDYLLVGGNEFETDRQGVTVVEALSPATICVSQEGKRCSPDRN